MILIARKTRNEPSHRISIIPSITKQDREEILENWEKFTTYSSLTCLQTRFSDNINKEFDIFSLKSDDFVKIVDGYGIPANRVSERDELQDALQTMYDHEGPYFLEVVVEMEENVFPMVASGDSVSNIRLE